MTRTAFVRGALLAATLLASSLLAWPAFAADVTPDRLLNPDREPMTLRFLRGGSSPDFSCRCASAATGVCWPSTPTIRCCLPGSETLAEAGGRSLYVPDLHH
jgi:hypothetical protein